MWITGESLETEAFQAPEEVLPDAHILVRSRLEIMPSHQWHPLECSSRSRSACDHSCL